MQIGVQVECQTMENPFEAPEISLRTKYERYIFLVVSVIVVLVIIVLIIVREIHSI